MDSENNKPGKAPAPADPSDTTRHVGDKVEQGVVKIKEGITEQSTEWEDEQERERRTSDQPTSDK